MYGAIGRVGGFTVALLSAVALGGCTGTTADNTVEYQADYPSYAAIQQLCDAATFVVTGRQVSSETRWVDASLEEEEGSEADPNAGLPPEQAAQNQAVTNEILMTVSQFEVSSVLAGVPLEPGTVIEVAQPGGVVGDTVYEALQYDLSAGDQLLFLSYIEGTPAFLLNPTQAGYTIGPAGSLLPAAGNSLTPLLGAVRANGEICG